MEFIVLKTKIMVSPLFFAVLTMFFISDKNGIAFPAALFSLLHECGHFLALLCVKTRPKTIRLSVFGIEMGLPQNLSTDKKIIVLMAGFFINYILSAVFFICGKMVFGYINLLIGIFTSLPLAATDGGAVLKTLLDEICAEKFFRIISLIFSAALLILLIFVTAFYGNYYLLFAIFYIILSLKK